MDGKKILTGVLAGFLVIGLSVGVVIKMINNNDQNVNKKPTPPVDEIKPIEPTTESDKLNIKIDTLDNQLSDIQSFEEKLSNSKFVIENYYTISNNNQQSYDKNSKTLTESYNFFIKDLRRNYISKIQVMYSYSNKKRDVSFTIKDTSKEDIKKLVEELFKDKVDNKIYARISDENSKALELSDALLCMKKEKQDYKLFYSVDNDKNMPSINQLNEKIFDLSNMFDSEVCGNLDVSLENDTIIFDKMVNKYLNFLNQKWKGNEIVAPKLMSSTTTYAKAEKTIDHYTVTKRYNVTKNDNVEDIIVKVECAIDQNKDNQLHYLDVSITLPLLSGVKDPVAFRNYLNNFVYDAGDFKVNTSEDTSDKKKYISYQDRFVPMVGQYTVDNIAETDDWVDSPVMHFKLYSYTYSSPRWETID